MHFRVTIKQWWRWSTFATTKKRLNVVIDLNFVFLEAKFLNKKHLGWGSKLVFEGLGVVHGYKDFPFNYLWKCMHRLALKFDPELVFLSLIKTLSKKILPTIIVHCLNSHVKPWLDATPTTMVMFDLWVSMGPTKYLCSSRKLFICILEASSCYTRLFLGQWYYWAWVGNTIENHTWKFSLISKVLSYAKDESTSLGSMTMALKLIILCEALNL
jgi:hypothetical protein